MLMVSSVTSKNATSSVNAVPCMQDSIPLLPWVPPAWLCCTVNVDSFDDIWPQLQSCLLLQVWPTKQCPGIKGSHSHICVNVVG